MIAARLPRTYDVDLLQRDLDSLRALPQAPQPGPYHDGEWTGLTLYEQGGGVGGEAARLLPYAPTPALERAPYLAELLDGLDCPKLLVRLLTLPPGADIGEHNDAGSTFQFGSLRLHVPLVTHDQVVMVIDGERMSWKPGELWWGDFSRPHWLRNDSDLTRVHMVIDVEINDFVLGLFPSELVADKRATHNGISMYHPPLPAEQRTDAELAPFARVFELVPQLMPLFGGGGKLQDLARSATARCRPEQGRLIVTLDGEPSVALERVAERRFRVVGQPQGV
ncbi:aspartyl/asparaginyl beta-hydroxylase domain-containing protein [Streptomyces sp. NBC_01618]|uniref:aspartyl/asparaginyl beta-hydroxylase domain-containing protein n=1 Tax=Streptomyces sp. NBC_01618 TaxID=2975900 RepID=UPI00386D5FCB|nr:aspartyl/asparaginyl beta-hydroxylase domain-containing protein [Streptomyces sp. NBC_01618]